MSEETKKTAEAPEQEAKETEAAPQEAPETAAAPEQEAEAEPFSSRPSIFPLLRNNLCHSMAFIGQRSI